MTDAADLLRRAASGDTGAFMAFYDVAVEPAYCLALTRARLSGLAGDHVSACAERATSRRFVVAFERAAEQAASGLSPLAWLLSLDVPADAGEPEEVAACA